MTYPQEIVVTTRNTTSLTLGIIATVIAVVALLFGWIPFLGLFAIPFAIIGLLLAGIGLLIALVKGFRGAGLPLLGGALCIAALILPLLSTGGTTAAIGESMNEVSREMARQRDALEVAKAAYIAEKLEVYDVSAKYMDSLLDGRVSGVLFKLRNKGDKTLDMVRVTMCFMDANGAVIAEEDYAPVNSLSFIGDSKPLKPGYVWQMEAGKFFSAKSVPSEWREGSVTAKVTDIQFIESE